MASTDVDDRRQTLEEHCRKFFQDNKIYDAETICYKDKVIENAYQFLVEIGNIIGFEPNPEED
jgi:hypothetical protein